MSIVLIHCQHVDRFSVVLADFSFLGHRLQQQQHIEHRLFVNRILLFDAAAIPRRQALQTTYLTHTYLYNSLIVSSLHNGTATSSISSSIDLMTFICNWNVLFTVGLLLGFICSFRKDILSSNTPCRVIIIIVVKSSPNGWL